MKKLLTSTAILILALKLHGQVSVGLRLGVSQVQKPATSFVLVNRHDPVNECLFNLEHVSFRPQLGLMARTENEHFWFMGEILYSQSSAYYSLEYLHASHFQATSGEPSTGSDIELYKVQKDYIELPISAGVNLGLVEISSGFSVSKDLKVENQFKDLHGYSTFTSNMTWGWHTGIGLDLQFVILELRYHRDFTNYGDGQFIHDQELSLRSPVDRFSAMVTFRIQ